MKINVFEISNLVVVALIFTALIMKKDVAMLFIALFVYGTFHFSFAAVALTSNETSKLLILLHNEGGGVLAKFSAVLLLGVVFLLLLRAAYDKLNLSEGRSTKIIIYITFVMGVILLEYLFKSRSGDWLQLKNIVSLQAMLAFVLVGYWASNGIYTLAPVNFNFHWLWGGVCALVFMNGIAFFEVFYHQSWAGTMQSTGEMVYRASSTLFNPNLLGFWTSLIYLVCAYGFSSHRPHRKIMFLCMVLSASMMYFSGSRSSVYLLLIALVAPVILLLLLKKVYIVMLLPLMLLLLTMLGIYVGATWVAPHFTISDAGWNEIALLGERLVVGPIQFMNYGLMKAGPVISELYQLIGGGPINFLNFVPNEIVESIEGRFVGEGRDAGWLVLYQDTGWFSLNAVILGLCILLAWGVRVCATKPYLSNIYALAAMLFCMLSGFVMRFQIFPVWLFVSLVLVTAMTLWSRPEKLASR